MDRALPDSTPVLVVGAGPAGLTVALLLARAGIRPVVVERHAGTSIHPRARGINPRTMEILRALGLAAAVEAAGEPLKRSRWMLFVETLAGQEIRRVPEENLALTGEALAQYTPCNWTQCAQDELEPLLLEAARAAGAEIHFSTELVALAPGLDGVTATVQTRESAERHHIRAEYVAACDGASSSVRQMLGIPVQDLGPSLDGFSARPLGHFVNIYFRADLSALVERRWFGICFVENPEVEGLFLAVNNQDRWLLNVVYDPGQGTGVFTPERCIELVRAAVGIADLPVEVLSVLPWEASARVAERFRAGHGRVFLAGDAAHTMPPAGGFGLNLGVQDAHNLAWKLAAVLQQRAGDALLDTYEAERLPAARAIVDRTVRDFNAESPDAPVPLEDPGEGWGGADLDPEAAAMAQAAAVYNHRYRSSAVLPNEKSQPVGPGALDLTGQPGTRVPHRWLQEPGGERVSTVDLCDGVESFLLFAPSEESGYRWREAADALKNGRVGVRVCPITDGTLLVRPDGIVACELPAVPTGDAADALRRALGAILSNSAGNQEPV